MFHKFFKQKNNLPSKFLKGFTLVELIVVIAIFAIISSVTLFNYGNFSSNLIVTNLAYQAALEVRQAQVYGISVKQVKGGTGLPADFNAAYGVWFDGTSQSSLQGFTLFSDRNGNFIYDGTLENEESIQLPNSSFIKRFCIRSGSLGWLCSDVGGIKFMSISFKRPNPDSKIYGFYDLGGVNPVIIGTDAEIQFTTNRGDKISRMKVTSTGQISIDSCNGQPDATKCQGF